MVHSPCRRSRKLTGLDNVPQYSRTPVDQLGASESDRDGLNGRHPTRLRADGRPLGEWSKTAAGHARVSIPVGKVPSSPATARRRKRPPMVRTTPEKELRQLPMSARIPRLWEQKPRG